MLFLITDGIRYYSLKGEGIRGHHPPHCSQIYCHSRSFPVDTRHCSQASSSFFMSSLQLSLSRVLVFVVLAWQQAPSLPPPQAPCLPPTQAPSLPPPTQSCQILQYCHATTLAMLYYTLNITWYRQLYMNVTMGVMTGEGAERGAGGKWAITIAFFRISPKHSNTSFPRRIRRRENFFIFFDFFQKYSSDGPLKLG